MDQFLTYTGYAICTLAGGVCVALLMYGKDIADAWQKVRQTASEAVLKQAMVERGMSADEMVRVLQTRSSQSDESRPDGIGELMAAKDYKSDEIIAVVQAWDGLSPSVRTTVRAMVEQEYSAAEINKVVSACHAKPQPQGNANQPDSIRELSRVKV